MSDDGDVMPLADGVPPRLARTVDRIGDRDLAFQAERARCRTHRVAKRRRVTAQVEQHREDDAIANDDLLDIADLDVVPGEGREECRDDTWSVATARRREDGG